MKKILVILTLLVTLFAFSSCDMVEDITGGMGDSLTTLYDTKIDVEYPELPLTVSYIFMDETNSSCKITKISHELSVQDRVDVAKSLFGVLSNDMTLEEAREERLNTI